MRKCSSLSEVRIDLLRLFLYKKAEAQATRKYKQYSTACASVNGALHVLLADKECDKLASSLTSTNNEIRVASTGYADSTGVLANSDVDPSMGSTENRMLAKALARTVLHDLHPDRGGDRQLFQQALHAAKRGDVDFLRYVQGIRNRNLTWQCQSGERCMHDIAGMYASRMSLLRSHPLSTIAQSYISGHKEEAAQAIKRYLTAKLLQRRFELLNLRNQK